MNCVIVDFSSSFLDTEAGYSLVVLVLSVIKQNISTPFRLLYGPDCIQKSGSKAAWDLMCVVGGEKCRTVDHSQFGCGI